MNKRTLLKVIAVLLALRAMTNVLKPLGAGTGLVFFGQFLTGSEQYWLGPLTGLYMLTLAWGYWSGKSWALPMGVAYVVFVAINLIGFYVNVGIPPGFQAWHYLVFAAIALLVPSAAVWLLRQILAESPSS